MSLALLKVSLGPGEMINRNANTHPKRTFPSVESLTIPPLHLTIIARVV